MIVSGEQIVSWHTHRGVQLGQFLGQHQIGMTWSRELREVSQCTLEVPAELADGLYDKLQPWTQWITVWDEHGRDVLWRGPIVRPARTRSSLTIMARDVGEYLGKSRCPLTKRWEAADPADIAEEMWSAMIADKGLNIHAAVRPDPLGDRFDYAAVKDEGMLTDNIHALVQRGLRWTVVGGVPYLGPMPLAPVASLGELDFIGGGIELVRDGATMFNDVVLRGADTISRARMDIPGQNLQTIVNVDDMFGVSNADRAVRQYVRHTGTVRDTIVVPDGAELDPDAPITIDQLIPSARIVIDAYGLLTVTELQSVKVTRSPQGASVAVTLASVNDDLPELAEIVASGPGRGQ